MTRMVFEKVSLKATRRWKDKDTGRKRQETREFFQTINPFNKNADGSVKTRQQIMNENYMKRDRWLKGEPDDATQ